jgi:hypothetical protein
MEERRWEGVWWEGEAPMRKMEREGSVASG